jgi:hypothetical protein
MVSAVKLPTQDKPVVTTTTRILTQGLENLHAALSYQNNKIAHKFGYTPLFEFIFKHIDHRNIVDSEGDMSGI